MKRSFFTCVFLVFFCSSVVASEVYLGSAIALEGDKVDYGSVHQKSEGVRVFNIANLGAVPLHLLASVPPGVESVKFSNNPVPSKGYTEVEVKINTDYVAKIRRQLFVFSSDFGVPVFSIPISADVVPISGVESRVANQSKRVDLSKIKPVRTSLVQAAPQQRFSSSSQQSFNSGHEGVSKKSSKAARRYSDVPTQDRVNSMFLKKMLY